MFKVFEYHQVTLIRNGCYVGLYRYDKRKDRYVIYRHVIDHDYGKRNVYRTEPEAEQWHEKWGCNEIHFIPKNYKLNNMHHLRILNSCLGGEHEKVAMKILDSVKYL